VKECVNWKGGGGKGLLYDSTWEWNLFGCSCQLDGLTRKDYVSLNKDKKKGQGSGTSDMLESQRHSNFQGTGAKKKEKTLMPRTMGKGNHFITGRNRVGPKGGCVFFGGVKTRFISGSKSKRFEKGGNRLEDTVGASS